MKMTWRRDNLLKEVREWSWSCCVWPFGCCLEHFGWLSDGTHSMINSCCLSVTLSRTQIAKDSCWMGIPALLRLIIVTKNQDCKEKEGWREDNANNNG